MFDHYLCHFEFIQIKSVISGTKFVSTQAYISSNRLLTIIHCRLYFNCNGRLGSKNKDTIVKLMEGNFYFEAIKMTTNAGFENFDFWS